MTTLEVYAREKVIFSPDGKLMAFKNQIFDTKNGKKLITINEDIQIASFSPDSKLLASTSRNAMQLWDIETGKKLIAFNWYVDSVESVSFSPDGRTIASASADHTIRLWNLRPLTLFFKGNKPTPLYHTFIQAVKFLWQLDVQGLEIVHKERTPADMERFGSLLAPPPPGQSKFDQVLEWAEKQQGK